MDREIIFARTLEEVKRKAKEQGNCISQEQLEEAFAELELGKDQLALVAGYLGKHKIGIGEPLNAEDYLTGEEIHYLDTYLEELEALMVQRGLKEITDGEREAITLSAMAGDRQAQARLTELYLPEVVEIAKLYGGQGVYLEDLIGEGNVAVAAGVTMLGCLEHPEEARGMLGKMIMDAMEGHINDSLAEAGSNQKIADKVNRVAEQAKELAQLLQRKVTAAELARETELTENQIKDAVRMSGNRIEHIAGEDG